MNKNVTKVRRPIVWIGFLVITLLVVVAVFTFRAFSYEANWFTDNIRSVVKHPELFTNEKVIDSAEGPVLNSNGDQVSVKTYKFTQDEITLLLSDGMPFECPETVECISQYGSYTRREIGRNLARSIIVNSDESTVQVVIGYY